MAASAFSNRAFVIWKNIQMMNARFAFIESSGKLPSVFHGMGETLFQI